MAGIRKLLSNSLLKTIGQSVVKGRGMCSESLDKPVKYSSSKAATWRAEFSRSGESSEDGHGSWSGQTYAVTGSVAAFLIYFCILREESDIDDILVTPLYDRIEGLEEVQLRRALEYRLDNGLPTAEITARLEELEKERKDKL